MEVGDGTSKNVVKIFRSYIHLIITLQNKKALGTLRQVNPLFIFYKISYATKSWYRLCPSAQTSNPD